MKSFKKSHSSIGFGNFKPKKKLEDKDEQVQHDDDGQQMAELVEKSLEISTRDGYRFPAQQIGYNLPTISKFDCFDFNKVLRRFMFLEGYCDAVDDYNNRKTDVNFKEVDLFQAVFFPKSISPRTPMKPEPITIMTENTVRLMWFRLACHYFEWITGVHELHLFNDADKIKIIVYQICKIVCLNCAYSNHNFNCSDPSKSLFMFGSGFYYDPARGTDSFMGEFCHEMYVQMVKILPRMHELKITKEEFVLLKLSCFFDCNILHGISQEGLDITRSLCTKYRTTLAEYVRHQVDSNPEYAHLSEFKKNKIAIGRVKDLLSFPVTIEQLVQVDDIRLSQMVEVNYGGMQGTLQKQIHTEFKKGRNPQ